MNNNDDGPIPEFIRRNKQCQFVWLMVANRIDIKIPKDIIRFIHHLIYEPHPAQLWHDRVFNKIIDTFQPDVVWLLDIPHKYGRTYMIQRLRQWYFDSFKVRTVFATFVDDKEAMSDISRDAVADHIFMRRTQLIVCLSNDPIDDVYVYTEPEIFNGICITNYCESLKI